jgi:glutathione S-transferase
MTDELVFYTNPMSRGRIVRWMLEEIGCPYRTVTLDFGTTMKAPEYLAINPMGKVPAITHRGVTVTEGAAICAYLADAFPEAGLAPPPGDPLRGPYYRWLFFAAGPVESVMVSKGLGLLAPPDQRGRVGYGTYEDTIDALETALRPGPHILGERFSAADVFVGASLGWGLMSKGIEPRPIFQEYVGRIMARPAARRANEIDGKVIGPQ